MLQMLLAKNRIIGPEYRFKPGGNETTLVCYQHKKKQHQIPLHLTRKQGKFGHRFDLQVKTSATGSPAFLIALARKDKPQIGYIFFETNYRGIGLTNVFFNITFAHLFSNARVKPRRLILADILGHPKSTYGALALFARFGFQSIASSSIRYFLEALQSGLENTTPQLDAIRGRGETRIPIIKLASRKIVFNPQIPTDQMIEVAKDTSLLVRYLQNKQAFLSGANYHLTRKARRIVPKYIRLLPENPEVITLKTKAPTSPQPQAV